MPKFRVSQVTRFLGTDRPTEKLFLEDMEFASLEGAFFSFIERNKEEGSMKDTAYKAAYYSENNKTVLVFPISTVWFSKWCLQTDIVIREIR